MAVGAGEEEEDLHQIATMIEHLRCVFSTVGPCDSVFGGGSYLPLHQPYQP